jgi:hypothetical protein
MMPPLLLQKGGSPSWFLDTMRSKDIRKCIEMSNRSYSGSRKAKSLFAEHVKQLLHADIIEIMNFLVYAVPYTAFELTSSAADRKGTSLVLFSG